MFWQVCENDVMPANQMLRSNYLTDVNFLLKLSEKERELPFSKLMIVNTIHGSINNSFYLLSPETNSHR